MQAQTSPTTLQYLAYDSNHLRQLAHGVYHLSIMSLVMTVQIGRDVLPQTGHHIRGAPHLAEAFVGSFVTVG